MAYVDPESVVSPKGAVKDLSVVYDKGPIHGSWSIATLKWNDKPSVGLRWNGEEGEGGKGNPQSRGNPTWFIVPEELSEEVLRAARRLRRVEEEILIEGYRAMAADREREAEADEWTEALIGDSSEAR
jgi:hypothetical protein